MLFKNALDVGYAVYVSTLCDRRNVVFLVKQNESFVYTNTPIASVTYKAQLLRYDYLAQSVTGQCVFTVANCQQLSIAVTTMICHYVMHPAICRGTLTFFFLNINAVNAKLQFCGKLQESIQDILRIELTRIIESSQMLVPHWNPIWHLFHMTAHTHHYTIIQHVDNKVASSVPLVWK